MDGVGELSCWIQQREARLKSQSPEKGKSSTGRVIYPHALQFYSIEVIW